MRQNGWANMINRARRARLIPMDAIRDDGGAKSYPPSWRDALHFLQSVRGQAATLQLDRSDGQPVRLIVMCEAAGMVPQLARVAHEYGIPVLSSGGFDSVTEKHAFAVEIANDGRPTEVLHIGDHDPSGAHMFIALAEDVEAFARELGRQRQLHTACRDTGADRRSWHSKPKSRRSATTAPSVAGRRGPVRRKPSRQTCWRRSCATPSRAGSTTRPCAVFWPARSACGGS